MPRDSIIEMIRHRWRAKRPFEDSTRASLLRKIESSAVREDVKEQARRELAYREQSRISG